MIIHDYCYTSALDSSFLFKHCFGTHASVNWRIGCPDNWITQNVHDRSCQPSLTGSWIRRAVGPGWLLYWLQYIVVLQPYRGHYFTTQFTPLPNQSFIDLAPCQGSWQLIMYILVIKISCTCECVCVCVCVCVYMLHSWVPLSVGGRRERERKRERERGGDVQAMVFGKTSLCCKCDPSQMWTSLACPLRDMTRAPTSYMWA